MKKMKMGIGRIGVGFSEEGREWVLVSLLYAGDLILHGETEEYLKVMVEIFVEVCKRRGLKAMLIRTR